MKKYVFLLIAIITVNSYAQVFIEWETNLGGSDNDLAISMQQTTDGGYIVAGGSKSNDGDVGENNGDYDFWIVKLDGSGSLVWETNLGGSEGDFPRSIKQTTDGGYIVAGNSESQDGDVGGTYGTNGYPDYWIVKLNENGDLVWKTTLGGSDWDWAYDIEQTTDGGYIVAGASQSNDGDVGGNVGSNGTTDYWIVKLDETGNLVWENNFGGTVWEYPSDIEQTNDGGYIVTGRSNSDNGDVGGNNGGYDFWTIKLDGSGNLVWETNLGGSDGEGAHSITQTTDGGYIIAGFSSSNNGDVGGNYGAADFWIVKLDSNGVLVWETNLGGTLEEGAQSIQPTVDGGYIITGPSSSFNIDLDDNNGEYDFWIVRIGPNGSILWEENLGGSDIDWSESTLQTNDGGYIIAGRSNSDDGDVGGNNGENDYWIVKLDASLSVDDYLIESNITLYPNPTENIFTIANLSETIKKVEILDLQGRVVISINKPHNKTVDIGRLQPAMYIVKVYASTNVYTQKFIKK